MSQFLSENLHIVFVMDLLEVTKALPVTEIGKWKRWYSSNGNVFIITKDCLGLSVSLGHLGLQVDLNEFVVSFMNWSSEEAAFTKFQKRNTTLSLRVEWFSYFYISTRISEEFFMNDNFVNLVKNNDF